MTYMINDVQDGPITSTGSCPQMALTDTALRAAKPHAKARKLFDGGGLDVEVSSRDWKRIVPGDARLRHLEHLS